MKKALRILLLMATALIIVFTLAACGEDAKSIKSTAINENGELIVTFTDGTTENLGKVTGEDGVNGSTPTVAISEDGYWIINDAKTDVKAEGKDGVVVDENPQGLDFYLLPDGTYGVKAGKALYMENVVIPSTYKQIKVTQILQNGFANAYNLKSITIPDSVTSIGSSAFSGCSSLASITIPNGVTSIGNYAFSRCSSLASITIGNSVTSIGQEAFYGCSSLASITIPNSVTSIGSSAFAFCSSLSSITIPNSVTSIGDWAFYYCNSLTSITIPNSVTSIGDWAFDYCTSLTDVYYKGTEEEWKAISIGTSNGYLTSANIHYNYTE